MQTDTLTLNLQGIAIDDGGGAGERFGEDKARQQQGKEDRKPSSYTSYSSVADERGAVAPRLPWGEVLRQ